MFFCCQSSTLLFPLGAFNVPIPVNKSHLFKVLGYLPVVGLSLLPSQLYEKPQSPHQLDRLDVSGWNVEAATATFERVTSAFLKDGRVVYWTGTKLWFRLVLFEISWHLNFAAS